MGGAGGFGSAPLDRALLHVADFVRLLQARKRITLRGELLPDIAIVIGGGNRPHDGRVIEFLVLVQLMSSRHSGSVEMADMRNVGMYAGNYITLLDLHVIDVVEQLDARRVHDPTDVHAPGGVVALVVV